MQMITCHSRINVFFRFCGSSRFSITTGPLFAALNSTKLTHNIYEHHTTLIGFAAAYKDPPL